MRKPRRPRRRLRAVEELEPAPTLAGRARPRLLQLAERAVEHGGRDPGDVLGEERLDVVEQPPEAAAGLRRDRDGRGPLAEAAVEVPPGLLQVDGRDVPLGEDDERGAPCLPRDVGDRRGPARRRPPRRRRGRARRPPARRPRAPAAPSSTRSPGAAAACGGGRRCRSAGRSCRRGRAACRSRRASCQGRRRRSPAPRRAGR